MKKYLLVPIFLVFFGFLYSAPALAETEVSWIIEKNTTWASKNSPYTLSSNVQITEQATLTIEPEVVVNGNGYSLEVWGNLKAIGSQSTHIIFNNLTVSVGNQTSEGLITIQFAEINSGTPYMGEQQDGGLILTDSRLKNVSRINLWYPAKNSYIERNIFENSKDIYVGTMYYGSAGGPGGAIHIKNNVFYKQEEVAVANYANYGPEIIVEYNSFLSTDKIALSLLSGYTSTTMTATNNYWGTTDEAIIDSMIFDKNDDLKSADYIEYLPILESPHENTPSLEDISFIAAEPEDNIIFSTTWTAEHSPYIVNDNLQIFEDTTLTIEKGVEVKVDPEKIIKVAGILDVNGSENNPVIFTSNTNNQWRGIEFINSKGSSIQNTFFENAQRVFDLKDNSEVEFVGNIFKDNGWVITDTNGYQSMQFNNNTAVNNEAVFYGIRTNGLSRFTNNVFQNNESVFHHGYYSGDITIENNNFINNDLVVRAGEKGYYDNFSMQNSWWGTTDTEEIDTMIEDKYDNVELHTLTYLPVKNSFIEGIGSSINIDVLPPVPPIITAVQSPITAALQVISGTKEANSSIWLDGNQIIALNSSTSWKYTVSLETGNNSFILTAKDSSGNESGEVNITITREESTEEETKESTEENNTEEKNTNETSTEGSDEEESKNETPEDDTEATQEEKTLEENEEIQEDDKDTNIDETEENNTSTQDQGTDDETESDQDNSEEGANGSDESQGSQQTTQENSGELSKEVEDEEENSNVEQTEIETIVDTKLVKRVKGTILLQVEAHGEAYYIDPKTEKGYYLGRPLDAFNIMRTLGLGATHEFITSHEVYPDSVVGKILLDVETNGEAYYIYPEDKKAYYLGRPSDAFDIMRKLGLGITNENLNKIPKAD